MTTEPKERRIRATIKSLAQKKNTRDEAYLTLEALQAGLQYPVPYQVWDVALAKGFQAGDKVVLKLHRGKAKREDADEAKIQDWYWDVTGIQPDSGAPSSTPPTTGAAGPHPAESSDEELFPPEDPQLAHLGGDPWYRYIAWGDLVREARLMITDTGYKPGEADYLKRFTVALHTICKSIQAEMQGKP